MEAANARRETARLLLSIRALADLSAEAVAAHDFATATRSSLMMIGGAISAPKSALLLLDLAGTHLETAVQRGLSGGGEGRRIPVSGEVAEALRQMRSAVVIAGADTADRFAPLARAHFPEMELYAPLVVRDVLLGVLLVGPRLTRQAYGADDLELILTLATMLAGCIHSHRLIQGLQETNQRLIDTQEHLLKAERLATLGELSAGIAHEVKNPLTSIRGFAVTIADVADEASPDEVREYAQVIVDASEQLKDIVDEVRDYAKGVRRTYEVAPVSLADIVEKTLSFTRFSKELRMIEVANEVEQDLEVCVNRDKVQQVLLNLLRNSAQAITNPAEGRIHLRVRRAGDSMGVIEISDNGCGIAPEAQEKIWHNWFSTKGTEGTGLGLGISRKIIEDHGGRLDLVRSEVGVGTTFALRLPASAATPDERLAAASAERAERP
jgi:signal transduction histidine kinase